MPDLGHYVDVQIRAATVLHDIHARLLFALHRCIASGQPLAVAWPDWTDTREDFGLVFRAFGAPEALKAFLSAIAPMAERGLVVIKAIEATPESLRTVTFYRDRAAEKRTPGYVARENRHRQARGLRETSRATEASLSGARFLRAQSGSTGQAYSLFIGRDADATRTGGASFGLGIPVPVF